jgi:methylmalonyl-CoA mutase cobalamin-binding domain/chain
MTEELKRALVSSVDTANELEALRAAKKCLDEKVPSETLVKNISEAFKVIGTKYEAGLYYLPELMFAGMVAQKVLSVLSPILGQGEPAKARGNIVIGTVRGDIHDLGKNIVSLMIRPSGFRVVDLGTDVSPEKFMEAIALEKASILCMSALLSTTREEMRAVIRELRKRGLRDNIKVIVGGGAVDERFAKEIGADAYGKDAIEAINLCKRLIGRVEHGSPRESHTVNKQEGT